MDTAGESTDPEGLSDDLESEAGKMKERADALGNEISDVREDWRGKQQDGGVPGAEPAGKPFADGDEPSGGSGSPDDGAETDDS